MYSDFIQVATETLSRVGGAYEASGRSEDLALYYLLLHESTLATLVALEPPQGSRPLHDLLQGWLATGRDVLRDRLEGRSPDRDEVAYGAAATALFEELKRLAPGANGG